MHKIVDILRFIQMINTTYEKKKILYFLAYLFYELMKFHA